MDGGYSCVYEERVDFYGLTFTFEGEHSTFFLNIFIAFLWFSSQNMKYENVSPLSLKRQNRKIVIPFHSQVYLSWFRRLFTSSGSSYLKNSKVFRITLLLTLIMSFLYFETNGEDAVLNLVLKQESCREDRGIIFKQWKNYPTNQF